MTSTGMDYVDASDAIEIGPDGAPRYTTTNSHPSRIVPGASHTTNTSRMNRRQNFIRKSVHKNKKKEKKKGVATATEPMGLNGNPLLLTDIELQWMMDPTTMTLSEYKKEHADIMQIDQDGTGTHVDEPMGVQGDPLKLTDVDLAWTMDQTAMTLPEYKAENANSMQTDQDGTGTQVEEPMGVDGDPLKLTDVELAWMMDPTKISLAEYKRAYANRNQLNQDFEGKQDDKN